MSNISVTRHRSENAFDMHRLSEPNGKVLMFRLFSTNWANTQTLRTFSELAKVQRAYASALFRINEYSSWDWQPRWKCAYAQTVSTGCWSLHCRSVNSNCWLACIFTPVFALFCRPGLNIYPNISLKEVKTWAIKIVRVWSGNTTITNRR